ncbi:MAG: hypothetical protein M1838_003058 [Thelocarpon superellum]|nr:MAG: hypothetical protein M1838_003058 [Thelocarpon superellum]
MSFSFGGFGQNANNANNNNQQQQQQQQQQGTGFGGFGGSNANPTGGKSDTRAPSTSRQHCDNAMDQRLTKGSVKCEGFGASSNTGFGATNTTGGGLFGNNSAGFGAGGFGTGAVTNNAPSAFGSTPASTGGGIFGGTPSTATTGGGFGGFGNNNAQNASPFGGGTSGGGLFGGASKPAFGGTAGSTTGTGLFGNAGASSGFGGGTGTTGGTALTGAFGAPASTALGGANVQCEGTGSTAFQPFIEKDTGTNQTNHFQTISFMQPYQRFSLEELRLADYAQGRRYNQGGAFGANTGFGGFGNTSTGTSAFGAGNTGTGTGTGGGLFGNNNNATPAANNTASPFGAANQPTNSPFGASTGGGGLFGSKPAATGLFGGATNAATSTPQAGGIFGTANATGGFGGGNAGGGSLFGASNNNAAKPSGFAFGNAAATNNTGFGASNTGGFGSTQPAAGGGLFGSNAATGSAFGGGAQQPNNANPFALGQNQTQAQGATNSPFGAANQNNQAKPSGGLFGAAPTNTVGGLFGNNNASNNQQPQGSNLFGGGNANNTQGGLFDPKPFGGTNTNPAGSNLFGNSQNNASGGGGLFGSLGANNQGQQNQGGGLFGGNNQQQPKPGGLFGGSNMVGSTNNANTGGGLFGGLGGANNANANQQQAGGLFGMSGQNAQQAGASGFGGSSLFGPSQPNQAASQPAQGLSTSILDLDPYGSVGLFNGLSTPNAHSAGPIATPLSSSQKLKKSTILPQYKITPLASSRLVTPQKRGYGFSYSTYASPSSVSSLNTTPLSMSGSLLGSGLGRSLSKSQSTSSLRRNFDSDESVLSPNAFSSAGSRRFGTHGLKKLTINRSIRTDLFAPLTESAGALPAPEKTPQATPHATEAKKRVSFEAGAPEGERNEPGNVFRRNSVGRSDPSAEELGFMRSSTNGKGPGKTNGASAKASTQPEMEQVRGNELAIVHEDGTPPHATAPSTSGPPAPVSQRSHDDQRVGVYWMRPSREELGRMTREQLKKVSGFCVGREGCGQVTFDAPVDLTTVNLDRLYDNEIVITTRRCTVYQSDSAKPPPGKGLNVPSTVTLENSWPRGKHGRGAVYATSGRDYERHLVRLKRVEGTHFQSYDAHTGTWIFTVDHFTTYGLDYEDDTDGGPEGVEGDESVMSRPMDSPTPLPRAGLTRGPHTRPPASVGSEGGSQIISSVPDDAFEFKKRVVLPGAFDGPDPFGDDVGMAEADHTAALAGQSFLGEGSVGLSSPIAVDAPREALDRAVGGEDGSVTMEDHEMAGSYPQSDLTTGLRAGGISHHAAAVADRSLSTMPRSILKLQQQQHQPAPGTPTRWPSHLGGDWTEQLQRTVSPRKQDRIALRASQAVAPGAPDDRETSHVPGPGRSRPRGPGIHTSIDLMHSLFGQERGFKWPYARKTRSLDESGMDATEQAFHRSMKPRWGPDGTLIYSIRDGTSSGTRRDLRRSAVVLTDPTSILTSAGGDVSFAKFAAHDPVPSTLRQQKGFTEFRLVDGIPVARLQPRFDFRQLSEQVEAHDASTIHEQLVWELASILFDDVSAEVPTGLRHDEAANVQSRLRKERLSAFWARLVKKSALEQARQAPSRIEEALALLTAHEVEDACGALLYAMSFRLATLVALIGTDQLARDDMREQLSEWRRLKVLSEMTDPIRALYELVAGQTCVCEGSKGALEDQARTFVMSDRFGLDWRQSFGLRLWYGILEPEPLEHAVQQYAHDLESRREEHVRPVPWFDEPAAATGGEGAQDGREDLLWGMLKLFTARRQSQPHSALEEIVLPTNHQLSPVNFRLAWQLSQTLRVKQVADFASATSEKMSRLTLDYAWQLETGGHWVWALFVALHLESAPRRMLAVQSLLARHGGQLGDEGSETFTRLSQEFGIPPAWMWEAKALYARSVDEDHVAEVSYLLKAHDWTEAHQTLCRTVAPQAIIEGEHERLRALLDGFDQPHHIADWSLGGQVYADFLHVASSSPPEVGGAPLSESGRGTHKRGGSRDLGLTHVIKRLTGALPAMVREQAKSSFNEMVAVQEMSGVIGKMMLRKDLGSGIEKSKILSLPLTEDHCLKHTVDLALDYYKAVMVGGK